MIELRDLRSLLTVASEQDLGRAARRLNIGQAPLAEQLREMERSLGVVLFERTNRRVELTRAGEALADGARRTLSELERALDEAQRNAGVREHSLRVHAAGYASEIVAADLLRRYRTAHPNVALDVVEELPDASGAPDAPDSSIAAVQRGVVDAAFVLGPVEADVREDSGLRALLVHRERFHLAVPSGHPLAARRQVSMRGLAGEPLVLLARKCAPRFHDLIVSACHGAGFAPTIALEADGFDALLPAVRAHDSVAFVPASFTIRSEEGVEFRPLNGMTATVDIAMVYRSGDDSAAVHLLLATGREIGR